MYCLLSLDPGMHSEGREGRKEENFPMLDTLLKIKPDAVVATRYLTAATRALLLGRDPVRTIHRPATNNRRETRSSQSPGK